MKPILMILKAGSYIGLSMDTHDDYDDGMKVEQELECVGVRNR